MPPSKAASPRRPTIAELEAMLNKADEGAIEIQPDGSVTHLSAQEVVRKELRLEVERIEVLRGHAKRLRDGLERIVAELKELLP